MEMRFGGVSGPVAFAPGHSVLLRREAVDKVGGYDHRFLRIGEDSDLSKRMREAGWETHYIARSNCVSIQEDTVRGLSNKLLLRSNWHSPDDYPLARVFLDQSKWFLVRLGRNTVKGRLLFLPIDVVLWIGALTVATRRTLAARRERRQGEREGKRNGMGVSHE